MNVICPDCGRQVPDEDIAAARGLAKCGRCDTVFRLDASAASTPPRPVATRAQVPRPPGVRVVRDEQPAATAEGPYRGTAPTAGALVLERRWFDPGATTRTAGKALIGLVAFYILSHDGFGGVFLRGMPILRLLLLWSIFVGGIGYRGLCGLVNRTRLRLEDGRLEVRHGPLPVAGNKVLVASEITQLWVGEMPSFDGRRPPWRKPHFALNARTRDGEDLRLMVDVASEAQARYVEQQLEARLGLRDVVLEGEPPR